MAAYSIELGSPMQYLALEMPERQIGLVIGGLEEAVLLSASMGGNRSESSVSPGQTQACLKIPAVSLGRVVVSISNEWFCHRFAPVGEITDMVRLPELTGRLVIDCPPSMRGSKVELNPIGTTEVGSCLVLQSELVLGRATAYPVYPGDYSLCMEGPTGSALLSESYRVSVRPGVDARLQLHDEPLGAEVCVLLIRDDGIPLSGVPLAVMSEGSLGDQKLFMTGVDGEAVVRVDSHRLLRVAAFLRQTRWAPSVDLAAIEVLAKGVFPSRDPTGKARITVTSKQ